MITSKLQSSKSASKNGKEARTARIWQYEARNDGAGSKESRKEGGWLPLVVVVVCCVVCCCVKIVVMRSRGERLHKNEGWSARQVFRSSKHMYYICERYVVQLVWYFKKTQRFTGEDSVRVDVLTFLAVAQTETRCGTIYLTATVATSL